MNKNGKMANKINKIGNETFEKLKDLQIPLYPKYYHDTFMDILVDSNDAEVLDLSKKYKYLFLDDGIDQSLKESCLKITKDSIQEFEQSNINLKNISNENIIDIDEIKKEPSNINMTKILAGFDIFQKQILKELDSADETIVRLKLEIEKLERESNIDPLTKTYNRRALTKDLQEILIAGKEKNLDMEFVIFDADDFKNINDTFGHVAGDKTLIFMTRLIENSIRKGVRIYRYGGEEFVVILNRSTLDNCEKIVQRIIKNADESKLLYKGNSIHLTLSAGITSHKKGDSADEMINRADKALYSAKIEGKNCYKVGK
ncbi:MAG: GGDEF domain-containing protein [Campylobacteraceae bacterium]|nr:GGDEF domain-containing protein [Campylobacteraceae bacterium]